MRYSQWIVAASAALTTDLVAVGAAQADWPSDPTVNVPICTAGQNQQAPRMVSDLLSGVFITWPDLRGASGDIYVQRLLTSGIVDPSWPTNGLMICNALSNQASPAIVGDGAGGILVAWQDFRTGSSYDIYAQHVLPFGTVDGAWPPNGRALCVSDGDQLAPACVSDGAAGAIVLWQDKRVPDSDVYAQHVLQGGQIDPAWPATGAELCVAVGVQQQVQGIEDGAGGAIVVWQDQRAGDGQDDIYAHHVLPGGTVDTNWPTNGRLVSGATGAQTAPRVIPDGSGGLITTWTDQRAGSANTDVYAQRVLVTGEVDPAWPPNGLAVCALAGRQQAPALLGLGAQGAIVAWSDSRPTDPGIYAMHLLLNGVADPAWPINGVKVCTALGSVAFPAIATDGVGGAIIGWTDFREGSSNPDIYAQHVRANAIVDPGWPVNGAAISTAAATQTSPVLVPDAAGGVIATWTDVRNGVSGTDIYAQRVKADGQLGGEAVDVPVASYRALGLRVWPNPARGAALSVIYTLSHGVTATLELLDLSGRVVATQLVEGSGSTRRTAFFREVRALPAGLYFIRLQDGTVSRGCRVALLR